MWLFRKFEFSKCRQAKADTSTLFRVINPGIGYTPLAILPLPSTKGAVSTRLTPVSPDGRGLIVFLNLHPTAEAVPSDSHTLGLTPLVSGIPPLGAAECAEVNLTTIS